MEGEFRAKGVKNQVPQTGLNVNMENMDIIVNTKGIWINEVTDTGDSSHENSHLLRFKHALILSCFCINISSVFQFTMTF